jgi:hypothetical protein
MRIGGHGLLVVPAAATRMMVTGDRELMILRGDRELARLTPGDDDASGPAVWFASGIARFGDNGPTLELADGVEIESVFTAIETGLPHVEWSALAADMRIELPADVVVVPSDPDFELHVPDGRDEFISFLPRPVKADDVVIKPAPYQRLVKTGVTDDEIPYTECAYEHAGKQWRQIFYAVPLPNDETVVVRAQASEPHAELLFQAAQVAATSLVPLR